MMRIMFFMLGVPMMILSFFEAVDVMPFVSQSSIIVDGAEIVLSQEQQESLETEVLQMFEKSHTLPAFGVILADEFSQLIQEGKFVSLKFQQPLELNGLPFDQLVFQVSPDFQSFNLFRGNKGVFQGRCINIDLMGENMQNLYSLIESFETENDVLDETPTDEIVEEEPEESLEEETEEAASNI